MTASLGKALVPCTVDSAIKDLTSTCDPARQYLTALIIAEMLTLFFFFLLFLSSLVFIKKDKNIKLK